MGQFNLRILYLSKLTSTRPLTSSPLNDFFTISSESLSRFFLAYVTTMTMWTSLQKIVLQKSKLSEYCFCISNQYIKCIMDSQPASNVRRALQRSGKLIAKNVFSSHKIDLTTEWNWQIGTFRDSFSNRSDIFGSALFLYHSQTVLFVHQFSYNL